VARGWNVAAHMVSPTSREGPEIMKTKDWAIVAVFAFVAVLVSPFILAWWFGLVLP
jgi:hypothetical protein